MTPYPKYTTTVIGAHSVPDWYEVLDRLVAVGQLSMASLVDAQYRASQAAILDQELAGIYGCSIRKPTQRFRIFIGTLRPSSW